MYRVLTVRVVGHARRGVAGGAGAGQRILAGRVVRRTVCKLYPQIIADLVAAAEKQAGSSLRPSV